MMFRRTLLASMVAVSCLMTAPQTAEAAANWIIKDASVYESRTNKLDIVGRFWPVGSLSVGAGVWYSIPVVPNGFIPKLNDSFAVEFGGFLTYWRSDLVFNCTHTYYRLSPQGGVRWDFMLTPEWTVFGLMKSGWNVGFGGGIDCPTTGTSVANPSTSGFAMDGGVGAYWNFGEGMAMRFEGGPFGLNVGISIDM